MTPDQHTPSEQRNLILAVVLSVGILVGWDYFFSPKPTPAQIATQTGAAASATTAVSTSTPASSTLAAPLAATPATTLNSTASSTSTARAPTKPIPFENAELQGALSSQGAILTSLTLKHHTTEEPAKGEQVPVSLFGAPTHGTHLLTSGWQTQSSVLVPDAATRWEADGATLTPSTPVTFTWKNPTGQTFKRTYTLDADRYTVHVTDTVENNGTATVTVTPFAQLTQLMDPKHSTSSSYDPEKSSYFRFVGPQAFVDGIKAEADMDDLKKKDITISGREGWIGTSSRYFFTALIPPQKDPTAYRFAHATQGEWDAYTLTAQEEAATLQPGQTKTVSYRLFAGPQLTAALRAEDANLHKVIDYGWFHFIGRPLFDVMSFINSLIGNMGWTIIAATLLLKLLLAPIAGKSYRSMAMMKKIQPRIEQLKQRYGDDRNRMAMEMMALYREYKVNPLSGCWPMLLQIPIFFAFYKVILISFEFRHAPFMFWITDLSSKDPYYVLPILMGLTMLLQQKLSPASADPVQQSVMRIMPVIFTFMFAVFPAGLVLYWTVSNLASVAQQWYVLRSVK